MMTFRQSDAPLEECLAEFGIESIHPALAEYPMMPDGPFHELVDSIGHEGLENNIVLTHDGKMLVDGRHRLKACFLSGMPPRFERLDPIYADDYPGYIKRMNWTRQSLTPDEVADIMAKADALREALQEERPPLGKSPAPTPEQTPLPKQPDLWEGAK